MRTFRDYGNIFVTLLGIAFLTGVLAFLFAPDLIKNSFTLIYIVVGASAYPLFKNCTVLIDYDNDIVTFPIYSGLRQVSVRISEIEEIRRDSHTTRRSDAQGLGAFVTLFADKYYAQVIGQFGSYSATFQSKQKRDEFISHLRNGSE